MVSLDAVGRLTPEAVETFLREGYLVVEDALSDADLQPVIDEIDAEVDRRARELVAAGKLSRLYDEHGFLTRLAHVTRETPDLARSIWNGRLHGPAMFDLLRHPKMLDIAESLCGPELIASSVYRLRPKVPWLDDGAVPWHQDSGYFEPYCDSALVLTIWLPLVDANEENGCLWVAPRVHRGEVLRHRSRPGKPYLEIEPGALPEVHPVCVPVRKGGLLLLHNRTPHVSYDNRTEIVRWSMDLRYQNAALPTNAAVTRLPGDSVPSESVPIACYPPEADFLVRSRLRPDEVIADAAAFARLRSEHQEQPVTQRWG